MTTNNTMTTRSEGAAPAKTQDRPAVAPPVDIYENAEELLVLADLPGVTKDQLFINFDKGQLTIEGRRAASAYGASAPAEQRSSHDYRRMFLVPQGIDTDRIAAELQNGVLRVHLPKSAALKPRQIEVKAG